MDCGLQYEDVCVYVCTRCSLQSCLILCVPVDCGLQYEDVCVRTRWSLQSCLILCIPVDCGLQHEAVCMHRLVTSVVSDPLNLRGLWTSE